jgi:hypothetical protein
MLTPREKQGILHGYGSGQRSINSLAKKFGVEIEEVRQVLTDARFILVGADAGKPNNTSQYCTTAMTGNRKDMISAAEANALMARWKMPS